MITETSLPRNSAFVRRSASRVASAIGATGLLVGLGAVSVTPAHGATASDCIDDGTANDNTLNSAAGDDRDDIQALLDSDDAVICLAGTFDISATLTASRNVELFGLPSAVLNGVDTQIFEMTGDHPLVVENLTFQNGDASSGLGGAISAYGVSIINSTFLNNFSFSGGAIAAYEVDVTGSTFDGNVAGDLGVGYGGAIIAEFISVTDSTFVDNVSSAEGGAVQGYAAVDIASSTFVDNAAASNGGAVWGADVDVTNTTFVGNDAEFEGGAIWAEYGQVTFSTFLNNTASAPDPEADVPGNAIYVSYNGESDLVIRGNIFAGSSANPQIGVGTIVTPDAITDLGGNIFSTSRSTETDVPNPADPSTLFSQSVSAIFGPSPALGDNGGASETVALVPGSPAIDAVPPLEMTEALTPAALEIDVDQRGEPRVGFSDAGAFELQADEIGGGGSELADTGLGDSTTTLLAGFAALLLGIGASFAIGTRRLPRHTQ